MLSTFGTDRAVTGSSRRRNKRVGAVAVIGLAATILAANAPAGATTVERASLTADTVQVLTAPLQIESVTPLQSSIAAARVSSNPTLLVGLEEQAPADQLADSVSPLSRVVPASPVASRDAASRVEPGRTPAALTVDPISGGALAGALIGGGLGTWIGAVGGGFTMGPLGTLAAGLTGMAVGCIVGLPALIIGCLPGAVIGGVMGSVVGGLVGLTAGIGFGAAGGAALGAGIGGAIGGLLDPVVTVPVDNTTVPADAVTVAAHTDVAENAERATVLDVANHVADQLRLPRLDIPAALVPALG